MAGSGASAEGAAAIAAAPFDSCIAERSMAQVAYRDAEHTVTVGQVAGLLVEAGVRVVVAGGAPRDWLSGQPTHDFDLSVDRDLAHVHAVLVRGLPGIDPVMDREERYGSMRWGAPGLVELDINILRSYRDIRNGDMRSTTFVPRASLVEDALMRDFSINSFYYDVAEGALLDPLGCGLADLEGRILRIITHPDLFTSNYYRHSFRILQFLCRGYAPADDVLAYLERRFDVDVQGMGGRLPGWIWYHFVNHGRDLGEFRRLAYEWARREESRRILDRAFAALAAGFRP
jgi:hypothetical protein